VANETSKSFLQRLGSGFFARYLAGDVVLDIGYYGNETGHYTVS
jgi:hypothetical protein